MLFPLIDMSSYGMLNVTKFKGSPFIVRRFDTDYNILPIKYLEEVRLISPSILNGRIATSQVSPITTAEIAWKGFEG